MAFGRGPYTAVFTLHPVTFADDTNLLYYSWNMKNTFAIVNNELENINASISLPVKKAKYSLFQNPKTFF